MMKKGKMGRKLRLRVGKNYIIIKLVIK